MSEDESVERLSVAEAAEALGVTRDAIHKRITRGSIRHEKGEDGRFYVFVDTSTTAADISTDASIDAVVAAKDETIAALREQLVQANERDRENRRIIAALTSRIPAIEAPASPESSESPEMAEDEQQGRGPVPDAGGTQEGTERRWPRRWREFFGLD